MGDESAVGQASGQDESMCKRVGMVVGAGAKVRVAQGTRKAISEDVICHVFYLDGRERRAPPSPRSAASQSGAGQHASVPQ